MWHFTACKISVSLSFEMKWFYSYLWITVANINSEIRKTNYFIFDPVQNGETNRLSDATYYDRINTVYINLLNLSSIKNIYFWGIWSL